MRILHAIPRLTDRAGGPTTALVGLATSQAAEGNAVTVLACTREGDVIAAADRLAAAGVDLHTVGPCRGPLMRHPQLIGTVRTLAGRQDIVHVHGVWEEVQYQLVQACLAEQIPFVIRGCGMLDEWSLRRKWLKKAVYRAWRLNRMLAQADAIHCTTPAEAMSTGKLRCGTPLVIEPNGICLEEFTHLPTRGAWRRSLAIGDEPLIVFLGRIHPGKGLEYLIPAFARLRTHTATLAVVGCDSGGYRGAMERLAAAHGVSKRVRFIGHLSGRQKIEALVDADVFCLPSQHENFGISIVEAMAAGCAVVVSEHVGVQNDVVAAHAGSVTSLDPDHIAAALDRWLADPLGRHDAGARARRFALQAYDWPSIARRWQRRYGELIATAVARRHATPSRLH